jgi:hypothetical protein
MFIRILSSLFLELEDEELGEDSTDGILLYVGILALIQKY